MKAIILSLVLLLTGCITVKPQPQLVIWPKTQQEQAIQAVQERAAYQQEQVKKEEKGWQVTPR